MTKEIIFHKYSGLGKEYLIYDVCKNHMELNEQIFHKLNHRNFGLGLDGILVGPFMDNDKIEMKLYHTDSEENIDAYAGADIFSKYLKDAGYVQEENYIIHTVDGDIAIEKKMIDDVEMQIANGDLCQSKIYWWC